MALFLSGLVIGWIGLAFLFPALQAMEGGPNLAAVTMPFLAAAWAALWYSLSSMFSARLQEFLRVGFGLSLSVGYALIIVLLARFLVVFPAPWKPMVVAACYGVVTAFFLVLALASSASQKKVSEVAEAESKAREPTRSLKDLADRVSSLASEKDPVLGQFVQQLGETVRYLSPNGDPQAAELETRLADGLGYLEQLLSSSPSSSALQEDAKKTVQDLQRIANLRSRMTIRS